MSLRSRVPTGVPTGGQFTATPKGPADIQVALATPRVEFEFSETPTPGVHAGVSASGWGSRAWVSAPSYNGGERFYWTVHQGGWAWDGEADSFAEAVDRAASEANLMLYRQEKEGFDWNAVEDYQEWADEVGPTDL